MLTTRGAFSGFAVDDIEAARAFYGDTLGVKVTDEGMAIIGLGVSHGGSVIVYPKPDHVPANYTILNFEVEDIDRAVDQLTESGVTLLRYDGLGQDDTGVSRGLASGEGPDIAWFADPAGNILSVLQG